MKTLSKAVLGLYVLTLLWLVLFKFSFDIGGVLAHHHVRSLNLIPFIDYYHGNMRETVNNLIVFIPFGLLLGVNFKHIDWRKKLGYIAAFSLAVEIMQFIFAIGITDITDVISNTLGGLLGLGLYGLGSKYLNHKILDWFIAVVILVLLLAILWLRIFVLKVKY